MVTVPDNPGSASLRWWEILGVCNLTLTLAAFGYLTVLRSNYFANRMTDFGVYARAAWALRTGNDLYTTKDDNGWHYVYPPTFAFLFLPFADPPTGADRTGYMNYDVGVVLVYLINLLLVGYSAHTMARVVLPNERRWSRRWWYARLIPFDVCLGGIGFTLSRAQANVLLVALIVAGFAATMRNRQIRAGFWWASCVVLKIFPAMLLAFPLVRREWRSAIGVLTGVVLLTYLVPASIFGLEGSWKENRRFVERVIMPSLGQEPDPALAKELHHLNSKPSQSFMAVLTYVNYPLDGHPEKADLSAKWAHWAISAAMIAIMFIVGVRYRGQMPAETALVYLGSWAIAMILIVPMSHPHYYAIVHPAAAGLFLHGMKRRPRSVIGSRWILIGLIAWGVCNALILLDGSIFTRARYYGLATWTTLLLWLWCAVVVWLDGRSKLTQSAASSVP